MDTFTLSSVSARHFSFASAINSCISETLSIDEGNSPRAGAFPRKPEIQYDRESEHLQLQNGSVNDATIGQLLGLRYVLTMEIIDVDIPEHCDLTFARLLKALNIHHIDYIGHVGLSKGTCDAIKCLDATLNLTLHGRIGQLASLIYAPPLHRLDIANTGTHTGDTWLFAPLRTRTVKLHELICTPARGQASGKTLLVLPVVALTLVKGTFGKIAAHALALNLHIASLTLISVPL